MAAFISGLLLGLLGGFSLFGLAFLRKEALEFEVTPVSGGSEYLFNLKHEHSRMFSSAPAPVATSEVDTVIPAGRTAAFIVNTAPPGLTRFHPHATRECEFTTPVHPTSGTLKIRLR